MVQPSDQFARNDGDEEESKGSGSGLQAQLERLETQQLEKLGWQVLNKLDPSISKQDLI